MKEGSGSTPARAFTERYVLMDGMRGVAAIAVLLYHTAWQAGLEKVFFSHGYLAVDFFFMLSGFVIADAYQRRLASGVMSLQRFVVVRLIRLYPMVVFGVCTGLAIKTGLVAAHLDTSSPSQIWTAFAANLILEPYLFHSGGGVSFGFPLNEPLWSIFWELLANIFYAATAKRFGPRIWLCFAIVAMFLLIAFSLTHNGLDRGHHEWLGGFVRVSFSFSTGVSIWMWRDRLGRLSVPITFQLIVLCAVMAAPRPPHVNALYDAVVVLFLFPLLVAASSRKSISGRAAGICEWFGSVSYPLYAYHNPLMAPLQIAMQRASLSGLPALAPILIIALGMVGASWLILVGYDLPSRRYLSSLASLRTAPKAQTAP